MKKFLYSIAFFFIILITPCIYSRASYLPPTLPDTSVVPSFLESVAQFNIVNDSRVYVPKQDLNTINQIVNGRTIGDSLNMVYLDNAQIDYEIFGGLYTVEGVEVTTSDTYTVFGTSDCGPFTMICEKGTGKILCQNVGDYQAMQLRSTLIAGNDTRYSFPDFVINNLTGASGFLDNAKALQDAVKDASLDSMIVYGNSLTASDKEFLSDYRFYLNMTTSQGWSVYVPNACTSNIVVRDTDSNLYTYHGSVPVGNPSNLQPVIYTRDPSLAYFSGSGSFVGLKQETNNVWGTSFTYTSSYRNAFGILYYGGSLDMELPTQAQFTQYKNASSDSVYLQPVENLDNPNEENIYNYTTVINNPPTYQRYINQNYNYEGDTNYNNYPTYYNYEFPTYPTTNNYLQNIYNYYTTPQIGGDVGQIDPEDITDGIPILNNLRYRFPFSIPFDIHDMISGLSVQREAPHFEWELYFPVIDYTWEIDFDLSAWDSQAQIFRICFLILFIIALGMWAYSHFFGS